ncbi:lipopolysaccharide export system protein LptC [Mycoplana sp. BE70]|uniref:LPS export ABC transporter periplasmic protein LptC n=1 Tax=Mycoplana sp. BE70 TaxID=2817775 RepID=UPI0028591985|nr:LPS export ABC transporter periplasmic protein LptC [Mycoplana sp. BE70]MDR6756955.1 lipopolysaccharide export system protein LptC [Mycoplana sp. BE70]
MLTTAADIQSVDYRTVSPMEAYRRAARHSARVRFLKIALPAIGLVIAAIFAVVSIVSTYLPEELAVESATIEDGKVVMKNPAISGRNRDGISYSMKADRALQDMKNPDIIQLENIRAKMPVNEKLIAQVDAVTGIYDRGRNILDMTAPFTIRLNTGLEAAFRDAHLDINGGRMSTQQAVSIQAKEASIVAQSLRMTDKGRTVVFEGDVVVNVDPAAIRNREK